MYLEKLPYTAMVLYIHVTTFTLSSFTGIEHILQTILKRESLQCYYLRNQNFIVIQDYHLF